MNNEDSKPERTGEFTKYQEIFQKGLDAGLPFTCHFAEVCLPFLFTGSQSPFLESEREGSERNFEAWTFQIRTCDLYAGRYL